jgi:hypothetical protein
MIDEPHWLVQELSGEAVWTALAFGAVWAWKHREEIRNKLRTRQPVLISAAGEGSGDAVATLTVGKSLEARWNVLQTVSTSVDLRWNVEAPTPSLVRRLEELAAWYLHVS